MYVVAALIIPSLVVLLLAVAVFERVTGRFGWAPWRKRGDGSGMSPLSTAGVEELESHFRGTKDFQRQMKQSSLMLREEESDGAPPRSRVDLDAGTANIVLRKQNDG
ncbi:DUF6191 domain-containing protein [Fodinicola acaciae]|uniref:DUF6191 domain-containing protein n=1 Tax=Fodinicola acaciae TaxID=2681555 RepID=UPI0013D53DF7|nr:DUF6191 domain-containing protein [Fodinicola acaciae]